MVRELVQIASLLSLSTVGCFSTLARRAIRDSEFMEGREEMYFKLGRLNRDSLRTLYSSLHAEGL